MKAHYLFLFLLFLSPIFSYQTTQYSFEKTWTLIGEVGSDYELNATFLAEDEEQKLSTILLGEGEIIKKGKNLFFHTTGNLTEGQKTITISAIVELNYDPYLTSDSPLTHIPTSSSPLENQAQSLIDKSSKAKTFLQMNDWVHNNIEYNLECSDIVDPEEVFLEKKGVCTAYSSLLTAFLNHSNIPSKHVLGHAKSEEWQAHSWIEVNMDGEWISADPTFNEIGAISATHIKTHISDSLESSDILFSHGEISSFNSEVKISKLFSKNKTLPINYSTSISNGLLIITLKNPSNSYLYVHRSLNLPENWGEQIDDVLLFSPGEEKTFSHTLIPSDELKLDDYYGYTVPFSLYLMDKKIEGTIPYSISGALLSPEPPTHTQPPKEKATQNLCFPLFAILLSFLLVFFHKQ